jgi:Inhibitor of vertebrate lysozyme (Ivy)
MNAVRWLICGVAAATFVSASTPAWSQGTLDADTLKVFGGAYMADCKDPQSAKATVLADALVFLHGDKRIAGGNVQAAHSFFGNSPPDGYRIALLAEAPGGLEMLWIVYEDRSGMYLTIDDVAMVGKPLVGHKFRRCDGAPKRAVSPPPTAPRSYAMTELDAGGILLDPKAKKAYYKALGPLVKESWLAELDGPSKENRKVMVEGTEYVLAISCKNHDCYDNNTVLLYSAAQGLVYGKIYQRGKSTLIGAPPPAVASELNRLWVAQWRSNP